MKQLDFFAILDEKPSAEILPFPANKLHGWLRDAAEEILALPIDEQANKIAVKAFIWRHRLAKCKLPADVTRREAEAFESALRAEITRQTIWGSEEENGSIA